MERGLRGLKTRTNAELFYFKVRVHPFSPCSPRSFLFKTILQRDISYIELTLLIDNALYLLQSQIPCDDDDGEFGFLIIQQDKFFFAAFVPF